MRRHVEKCTSERTFFSNRPGAIFPAYPLFFIINGKGFDFKEVEVSEEKRLDIVITFENQKYIIELKIWRAEIYHQEGIKQLCDYLDRQNQSKGYLLIYDLRKKTGRPGEWGKIEKQGKEIYAAWV